MKVQNQLQIKPNPQSCQTSVSGCCGLIYKYKGVYFKVETQVGSKRTYCLATMYLEHCNGFHIQTGIKSIEATKNYIKEIISRTPNKHLILKTISEKYIKGDYGGILF
jgi:hypothetical protein